MYLLGNLRNVAYQQYIQLVYDFLGKRRRMRLLARDYDAIRGKFEGNEFEGYDDKSFQILLIYFTSY